MIRKHVPIAGFLLVLFVALLVAACAPGPATQPEVERVVTEIVEVAREVEREVTVIVEGTPVVEMITETVIVTATPEPTPEPDAARIEQLDIAQLGNPVDLTCWDWTSVDEIDILFHFAEPLWRFDREGNLEGVVLEDWEMISPTEWVLNIRQGMQFHDPEFGELTAEDVVASLEYCFREDRRALPKQPGVIGGMELEIEDDYTVRVRLPEPGTGGLPDNWTYTAITAAGYLEQVGDDFNRRPMGTGPFRFDEWVPNVRIAGERFENYWGEDPGVERIVWRVIPDAFTRLSEFQAGGIDILPFMVAEWVPEVENDPDLRVEQVLSARYIMVVLPVREPPFDDQRVRQALNYAVNKDEIVEQLFLGVGAVPPTGVVNPVLPEGDPDREIYPYDPDRAMELLDEARDDGVEIGTITLYAPNDRYVLDREMGEAVAGYWRAIGLDVEYIPESRTTLFPRVQALEMTDPAMFGFGNTQMRADYPFGIWLQSREDPPSRGFAYAAGPPEWDEMISELASMASGTPESIELARELDSLWVEYAPWVWVINYVDLYGVHNDVEWSPYPHEVRFFTDVSPRE
jgi:peptide/nickel transport system substrate-binding protein